MLNASTASRLPWRNATDERLDQRRDKKPMKLIKRMQIIIHCGTWHLCLIYWKNIPLLQYKPSYGKSTTSV